MNKSTLYPIALLMALSIAAPLYAADSREKVEFPAMMRDHMMGNMRDHLLALSEIQLALSNEKYEQAADIAEKRLGMSSMQSHGASHMAPHMPKSMQKIGTQMHRAASRFAIIAQESDVDGNLKRSIGALGQVMQQCVACHVAFRVH